MAERKTFGNKVGTPRGYVDRAARDKVDEDMQPLAELGKQVLFLTPMGRPIRGAKALYEGGKAFLRGTTKQAAKEAVKEAAPAAAKTVSRRAAGAPRPARGVKPGSARQETLDSLKQGPKMPSQAKDVKPGSARQKILDSLKQGPKQPEKAADMKSGGARANALKEAKASNRAATRKPRPGEKKFIGPVNKPKPGDKNFIGPSNKPQPGEKNFIGPMNRAPKPGEKGFIGPMRGAAGARTFGGKLKAGAAAGAGLLGFAAYKNADKPKASGSSPATSQSSGPRDDRASSKSDKAAAFRAKQQGMNTPGSPTNPNTKKPETKQTGDKSRLANPEKKFSNFERMKQRQYEKEGFGGRSMTSSRAKERVKTERGFKFKDLFKKK